MEFMFQFIGNGNNIDDRRQINLDGIAFGMMTNQNLFIKQNNRLESFLHTIHYSGSMV